MGNKYSRQKSLQTDAKTVFESDAKTVYRIPALFYYSDRKLLLAFAEKRLTADDASALVLVMKTGKVINDETTQELTTSWSELKLVQEAQLPGHRTMNPCPVYDKASKTLFLFFVCIKGRTAECWQRFWGCNSARLCYITTTDAGESWSAVTDLTESLPEIEEWATFAVGPGHGLQTESGRLIVPTYGYASCSDTCCCIMCYCSIPYALYLYSDNNGKTWQFGKRLQTKSVECEMVEIFDDAGLSSIYCNARNEGGYRVEAVEKDPKDGFITLSSAQKLVETGNGCQGSVVSFPVQQEDPQAQGDPSQNQNKWLLYTHPTDKSKRINLGVYLNKVAGDPNTWSNPWIINSGPSAYSDLAYIGDACFVCLMECGRKSEIEQIAAKVFSYHDVKLGIAKKK